jgi:hypothetical protein
MFALDRGLAGVACHHGLVRNPVEEAVAALILDLGDARDRPAKLDLGYPHGQVLKGLPSDGVERKVLVVSLKGHRVGQFFRALHVDQCAGA